MKYSHLSYEERIIIEQSLNNKLSLTSIASILNRSVKTVSRDIRLHLLEVKKGSYGKSFNNCSKYSSCKRSYVCAREDCKKSTCRSCSKCYVFCKDYNEYLCPKLSLSPYVCNGCIDRRNCSLKKAFYYAKNAYEEYQTTLSESRQGFNLTPSETKRLDDIISPLIKNGQSIHNICQNNKDLIMYCERSVYNYIDNSLFSARNIDMPRKVRFKPRKTSNTRLKIDTKCRVGRTYDDYLNYLENNPDTCVAQMDTVEGVKGGKVLLTLQIPHLSLMLAYLRDANTSQSVIDIIDSLYDKLGQETFKKLFPLIITDNGSEFSNPLAIEFDGKQQRRTKVYYCDPSKPYQKPNVENSHTLLRRIVPKGTSSNHLNQLDVDLMINHINSYGRAKLNESSPLLLFKKLFGQECLNALGLKIIKPNDIVLTPDLIK